MKLKTVLSNTGDKHIAYLGLGTNLGNKAKNLKKAILEISKNNKIIKKSAFYSTDPIYYLDQDWFYNMTIKIETVYSPQKLLKYLLAIEKKMKRKRTIQNGPRIIDIDILLYDKIELNLENLKIPHPELHKRRFVLAPLNEIAPNLKHPTLNKSINMLLNSLRSKDIAKKVK